MLNQKRITSFLKIKGNRNLLKLLALLSYTDKIERGQLTFYVNFISLYYM